LKKTSQLHTFVNKVVQRVHYKLLVFLPLILSVNLILLRQLLSTLEDIKIF
jgi:hypothetical protein